MTVQYRLCERPSVRINRVRPSQNDASNTSSFTTKSVINSIAAGYIAGVCGVVIGHPLDSLKVLLQTNPDGQGAPSGTASASATASITCGRPGVTRTSIRALYAGITGPLITIGLFQSSYFAVYDSVRRVLHRLDVPDAQAGDYLYGDSMNNVALSAAVAGSATTIMTSPMLVIKTKQQIMVWGFRQAIRETLCVNSQQGLGGLRNFYVGFAPHFMAVTFGRCAYMAVYEGAKRALSAQRDRKSATPHRMESTISERIFSASLAGMINWALIYPLDSVQNMMYQQTLHGGRKTSIEMARDMYQRSGGSLTPFFRGFTVTVLRAGPVAAVVLPVYDMSLEWLSKQ